MRSASGRNRFRIPANSKGPGDLWFRQCDFRIHRYSEGHQEFRVMQFPFESSVITTLEVSPCQCASHTGSVRNVHLFSIFLHHPAGGKVRSYRADRLLHNLHPTPRNISGITLVESRNNLFFQQAINRFRFRGLVSGLGGINEPTIRAGVALGPPTIGNAQVWNAVDGGFHPACAARLQRFSWIVEPDITSLNEEMRYMQVVLVDKCNPASEPLIHGSTINAL